MFTATMFPRPRRATLLALLWLMFAGPTLAQSLTPSGTVISNRALVIYSEPDGSEVTTETNIVTVTVAEVPGVVVTPDEAAPSGELDPQSVAALRFSVCNSGNSPLAYVIGSAAVNAPASVQSVFLDSDDSGTATPGDTPVSLGVTRTPTLAPDACAPVVVVIATNDTPTHSQLLTTLAAHSPAGTSVPAVEDTGAVVRTVRRGPRFTDPDDPNLPPRKSVNGQVEVVVTAATAVDYEIAFRNVGEVAATGVVFSDVLPSGLSFVAGSLRLQTGGQSATLTDAADGDAGEVSAGHIAVRIDALAPDAVARVTFSARVSSMPGGSVLTNVADVAADNAEVRRTREARVLVAPQGVVFVGDAGGDSRPVRVASVRLTSSAAGAPASLPSAPGFVPNAENLNPFQTGGDGLYSFRVDAPNQPLTYYLLCEAAGYRPRVIQVNLTPQSGQLFGVTVTALDGQPLAVANGFALTPGPVALNTAGGLAWNVPMFDVGNVEVSKEVDRAAAEIGDVLTYRVTVRNNLRTPVSDVELADTLPQGFYYAPGTALTEQSARTTQLEPEVAGEVLTWRLPTIAASSSLVLTYRVRIGPTARLGEQYNTVVARRPTGTTPPARVPVTVRGGIFSTTQLIAGRVFIDDNENGLFDGYDKPVAGARVVLSNGYTATTDAAGNYNFPVIADGALVAQLDPSSVPEGFVPRDKNRADGSRWSRLVTTPLQQGALLHVTFALAPSSPAVAAPALRSAPNEGASAEAGNAPRKPSRMGFLKFWRWGKRTTQGTTSADAERAKVAPTPCGSERPGGCGSAPRADGGRVELAPARATYEPAGTAAAPSSAPDGSVAAADAAAIIAPVRYVPAPSPTPLATASAAPPEVSTPTKTPVAGVARVEPGAVSLGVEADAVASGPGFDVPVRYALGYEGRLYLNGVLIDKTQIGERRTDQSTHTEQALYVGLTLAPGPNTLRAVAVAPDGTEHGSHETRVYGRGPAVRMAVEAERAEMAAGRHDKALVTVRAFDEWGHPAADGEISVSTTAGEFDGARETASVEAARAASSVTRDGDPALVARPSSLQNQITLKTVNGVAQARLVAADAPGRARITADAGVTAAQSEVRFIESADAPRMVVGLGTFSVGRAAPANELRGVDERARGALAFFYKGRLWSDNVLTLSYDSQRPLQRIDARDRLFQIDPLEHNYSVFGDSSTRFNAAQSNSKLYARLDLGRAWGRSHVLFGDFVPETRGVELATYNRRLTGLQVHLENKLGFVSVAGARPSSAFARDVFPGGTYGFARLSARLVVPGSEVLTLEVRDRHNPDLVVRRETLQRGADYNLDSTTGELFFIRPVSAFDPSLNLQQIVVTYEYEASGSSTNVYTLRASTAFGDDPEGRPRVGISLAYQGQGNMGHYVLGGMDLVQAMPNGGQLRLEYAVSEGVPAAGGNYLGGEERAGGVALLATYDQPFRWRASRLQFAYRHASAGFNNPFGASVIGGTQRVGGSFELQTSRASRLRLSLTDERNSTDAVENSRQTFGLSLTQALSDKLSATIGYDFRRLDESSGGREETTNSHMVTAGFDWRPSDRLQLSARREQSLAGEDPTYPSQTVLSGSYRVNNNSRVFVTQRLSNAPIQPISDLTGSGFSFSESRNEFTAGVETKLLRDTSLVGGYRLEEGTDGTDGFAFAGLTQKVKLNKELAADFGFERAFRLSGGGSSRGYNSLSSGLTWQPRDNFVANGRYEWRTRGGSGQIMSAGFAGKPDERVTALGRFQFSRGSFDNRQSQGLYASLGVAVRPLKSERVAAFFNYQRRSLSQGGLGEQTRERTDTLSADAFVQALPKVSLFGKVAVKSGDSSRVGVASAPTLTYLLQGRAEYRVAPRFDFALEARYLAQPSTRTSRLGFAPEVGFWATPDVRFGFGYNVSRALEQPGRTAPGADRRGFYFNITTKLERVFDFWGARKKAEGQ